MNCNGGVGASKARMVLVNAVTDMCPAPFPQFRCRRFHSPTQSRSTQRERNLVAPVVVTQALTTLNGANRRDYNAPVVSHTYLRLAAAALLAGSSPLGAQQCAPAKASQQVKIVIASVEFPVNGTLPEELRAEIRKNVQEHEVSVDAGTPDNDWLDELNEVTARDTLMNAGYFHAQIRTTPFLIRAEARQRTYAVQIETETGPLFRLGEVRFEGTTVFTHADLRKQLPVTGELFSLPKVRRAIESISRMYRAKGYIDLTVEPVIDVDDENRQINLTFKLSEEVQYRVGSVKIVGVDDATKNRLTNELAPDSVLDMSILESFRAEDDRAVEIRRHTRERIADIILDVRKKECVETSSITEPRPTPQRHVSAR